MSYADAAVRGAVNPESDDPVPIENVNITQADAESAFETAGIEASKAVEAVKESVEPSSTESESSKKIKKALAVVKDDIDYTVDELKDPVVASSALVSVLAIGGVAYGLVTRHRVGKLNWQVGLAYAAGLIAFTGIHYFTFQKVSDKYRKK